MLIYIAVKAPITQHGSVVTPLCASFTEIARKKKMRWQWLALTLQVAMALRQTLENGKSGWQYWCKGLVAYNVLLSHAQDSSSAWENTVEPRVGSIPGRWALHLTFCQKNALLKEYTPNQYKYTQIQMHTQNEYTERMQSGMADPFGDFAEQDRP